MLQCEPEDTMAHWSKGPNREATLRKIKNTQIKKGQRKSKKTEFKKGNRPWNAGTKPYREFVCENCGGAHHRPKAQKDSKFRFCSSKCWYEYQRTNHPRIKEGTKVRMGTQGEYIGVRLHNHPNSPKTRYVLEHR